MQTVLVVEDNPINWKVFQRVLTKRGGFMAKHTEDVGTVMQMAASREVDIILMDVNLDNSYYKGQRINGIRMTQMLKSNPQTANLPVILVTANWVEDRNILLHESGADGYIPKPVIDYQAFVEAIRETLYKAAPPMIAS